MSTALPSPSLVVLVGAPASGKSTWAAENFAPAQILSSDALRGIVGEHDLDLDATDDVFEIMDRMLEMRMGRGLTTVVDTTGLDPARRGQYLDLARRSGVHCVVVRFATSAAECKRRNRERTHPVPVKALDSMLKLARAVDLDGEGWDLVIEPEPVRTVTPKVAAAIAADPAAEAPCSLRFGLLVSRFDGLGEAAEMGTGLARIARQAEDVGFDSLWVMDHMIQIPQVGPAWDPMLESYATMGFLAAVTSRIRLGVLVTAATFRNIGHLAKIIATLDVLSGGRAIAGIGAANSSHEHSAYGWAFPSAPQRLARLEDALQALPVLWGPGNTSFDGKTISIPDTTCYPRPIQAHVPIIVGGSGENVTLRLAAQYADGCNLFGDVATVKRRVDILHAHCADVGRDPADVEVTHLGEVLLGADTTDLATRIERLRPANTGPDRYAASVDAGTTDDHEASFRALAAAGVQTAILTTPDVAEPGALDSYADLISRFRD
ncbi:MAG: TIGR03560 family F420-dependent LLM class oxidoreductase [Acidimicrobiales bacterium]